jgi:hypothetical protein
MVRQNDVAFFWVINLTWQFAKLGLLLSVDSTDPESGQLFAALFTATIRAAVAQTWRFISVEEE